MPGGEAVNVPRRFGPWRREATAGLELLALASLAVAQPTFDLLGKNARLFIAWRTTRWELVALTVIVALLPAAMVWLVEVAVGLLAPRARPTVHLWLIGALAGVVVVEAFKVHTGLPMALVVMVAIAVGGAIAVLVGRVRSARTWLHFLAVAVVAFPALFLFASPAHDVVIAAEPTAPPVKIERPKRVVMIVLDELPTESLLDGAGRIDQAHFPNFAALADTATWYRNATTVAPNTEAAVPAILTGLFPGAGDAAPVAQVYPRNLFTMLAQTYSLNVHESITRLCPVEICPDTRRSVGVHPGFAGMIGDVATIVGHVLTPVREPAPFGGLGAEDFAAFDTAEQFVRSIRPASRPRLDFVHVLLPHFPWHYLATGQDYAAFPPLPAGQVGGRWTSAETARIGRQRHLLQAGAVDVLLGQVVDRLEALGVYDDTVIVVTADHGVAFEPHLPFRGVAEKTHSSIMWTPLFVKRAGQQRGVVDDRPALSVDVLPTLVDELDAHPPWKFDGRSLFGDPRRDGQRPIRAWTSNAVSPTDGDDFLRFDGPSGFDQVLKRRGIAETDPTTLGVYRTGKYGALVGQSPYPMVVPGSAAGVTIDDPIRYQYVDHAQPTAPWATLQGTIARKRSGQTVAIAMNGVVAGVAETVGPEVDGRTEYWAMLAPELIRDGSNLVQIFVVDGPVEHPRLRNAPIQPG